MDADRNSQHNVSHNIMTHNDVAVKMKITTKSPLKDKPLRYVAQSADEALEDLLLDKVMIHFLVGWGCLMSILYEWLRYFRPLEKPPMFLTSVAAGGVIFCGYKLYKHFKKVKHMKLGRDGERVVGQYLELLRENGYRIYHDIIGKDFNIDHVVISQKGIFVIETKTYSKPVKGKSSIRFDGKRILVNGKELKTDIISQVKAASSHVREILRSSTGKNFEAFPVVLFPGWYVEGEGNKKGEVWVLEPKAFKKFIDRQMVKLSAEDVALASYHLSRHIRTNW